MLDKQACLCLKIKRKNFNGGNYFKLEDNTGITDKIYVNFMVDSPYCFPLFSDR